MSGWVRFQSQFYETAFERRQRFQMQKDRLRAQGKCWQCAKPVNECECPNLDHFKAQTKPNPQHKRARKRMSETLDSLHERLRARVKNILAQEATTEEAREVRLMSLYAAYERYGNDADKLRGITK